MALQPASGAQDLLPREVGANRSICDQLAAIYSRWGYEEVMPPSLERLGTLEAVAFCSLESPLKTRCLFCCTSRLTCTWQCPRRSLSAGWADAPATAEAASCSTTTC